MPKPGSNAALLFAALLLATSCSQPREVVPDESLEESPTSDADAIRTTREQGLAAFAAGDVDSFMNTWPADDIVVMMPGAPPFVGKPALRAFLEQAFASSRIMQHLRVEERVIAGEWAFERFALFDTIVARTTGDTVLMEGKAVDIYRRQPDGSWKVARSILNYDR